MTSTRGGRMGRQLRSALTLVVFVTVLAHSTPPVTAAPGDGGPLFYAVHPYDNADDYGDRAFQPVGASGSFAEGGSVITMTGKTVESGHAIAVHPVSDVVYVILKLAGTDSRTLATLDPATGLATEIGTVTLSSVPLPISNMTFNEDGSVLYGISGDGGGGGSGGGSGSSNCKACLVTINVTTGLATLAIDLDTEVVNNDAYGESIVFNPDDDLIYHLSGYSADRVFETIDPANSFARNTLSTAGAQQPEAPQGLGFDPVTDTFYVTDWFGELYTLSGGNFTFVDEMRGELKGLALVSKDTPVAVDNFATFAMNQGLTFVDVLENDIDGGVTPVGVVQSVSTPANGTASVGVAGSGVRYQPDLDECHTGVSGEPNADTFTYTLDTGSTATVFIEIPCPDDDPTITLKYVATKRMFKGKVIPETFPACASGIEVRILKQTTEDTFEIGTTTTAADGTFKLKKRARGKYYADSDFHELPQTARCFGSQSPIIKVK